MYSAALQMTMNASRPTWSSDGWSFVPVSLSSSLANTAQQSSSGNDEAQGRLALATVNVPAVRARLQCSPLAVDIEDKFWLTELDLTGKGTWNETLKPRPWKSGYLLGCSGSYRSAINFNPNMTGLDGGAGNCSFIDGMSNEHSIF